MRLIIFVISVLFMSAHVFAQIDEGVMKEIEQIKPKSLTEAEYDKLLSKRVEVRRELVGNAGPIAIKAEQWWDAQMDNGPSLWLKLQMHPIPNLSFSDDQGNVEIIYALSKSGHNVYDKKSGMETDFNTQLRFSKPSLWQPDDPAKVEEWEKAPMEATRTVYMIKGTEESDITGIKGKVNLNLPLGLETLSFATNELDKPKKTSSGAEATLKAPEQAMFKFGDEVTHNVTVHYVGPKEHLVQIVAYNAQGQQLRENGSQASSSPTSVITTRMYKVKPEKVEVIIASDIVTREYPFLLGEAYKKTTQ